MGIYERKLLTKARPMMAEDEQVEVVAMAKLGSVRANAGRSLAAGVAVAVATGGAGFALTVQAEAYFILTDRQVLVFQSDQGAPGKHLATIPRHLAHPVDVKDGTLFIKFFLHVDGWQDMLKLTVPPLPPRLRKRARLFIKSLGG
ncbi:hypothetical protein [Kutzneria sp. CA-103260]|uniref:hypothetical protein n=1 Tax=Kutzneria sp. CA-103260 TaxID=2802641 RepID=UPI001BA7D153|nr:hypothetical protein [Kutzneria sp. CA-103260]QUQ63115.1 hypothetical protein JJ691_08270 [Kutzneria sp. CA-103260]